MKKSQNVCGITPVHNLINIQLCVNGKLHQGGELGAIHDNRLSAQALLGKTETNDNQSWLLHMTPQYITLPADRTTREEANMRWSAGVLFDFLIKSLQPCTMYL
jgi:hypothetical protein